MRNYSCYCNLSKRIHVWNGKKMGKNTTVLQSYREPKGVNYLLIISKRSAAVGEPNFHIKTHLVQKWHQHRLSALALGLTNQQSVWLSICPVQLFGFFILKDKTSLPDVSASLFKTACLVCVFDCLGIPSLTSVCIANLNACIVYRST